MRHRLYLGATTDVSQIVDGATETSQLKVGNSRCGERFEREQSGPGHREPTTTHGATRVDGLCYGDALTVGAIRRATVSCREGGWPGW
jgi:hypothetical protein